MHMAAPLRRPAPTVPAAMIIALVAAVVATMAGCGSSDPLGGGSISGDLKSVVVGSADFPESKIVAEIYAQALATNGFTVRRQFGIGSRETYIPALQDHSIDLIPDYTGNLLQHFDPANTVTGPEQVELALVRALPGDLSILTPAPADDTDTVTVTADTAQKWNLRSIADLAFGRTQHRINDAAVDAAGRLWIGTMMDDFFGPDSFTDGQLYRLDPDGTVTGLRLADGRVNGATRGVLIASGGFSRGKECKHEHELYGNAGRAPPVGPTSNASGAARAPVRSSGLRDLDET